MNTNEGLTQCTTGTIPLKEKIFFVCNNLLLF